MPPDPPTEGRLRGGRLRPPQSGTPPFQFLHPPLISVPEWLRRLQYISVPEWLSRLQYISVRRLQFISVLEWLRRLQHISVPEWLQYISVPEWLRRLQYISVLEWLSSQQLLACQNNCSLHCKTLACQNGSLHCNT